MSMVIVSMIAETDNHDQFYYNIFVKCPYGDSELFYDHWIIMLE